MRRKGVLADSFTNLFPNVLISPDLTFCCNANASSKATSKESRQRTFASSFFLAHLEKIFVYTHVRTSICRAPPPCSPHVIHKLENDVRVVKETCRCVYSVSIVGVIDSNMTNWVMCWVVVVPTIQDPKTWGQACVQRCGGRPTYTCVLII